MTKRIVITPRASQDIDEHFTYIAQNNSDAALRFFDGVRQTYAKLAQMSGMGRPYPVTNPRLEGLRKWSVKGFDKHLIFYLSFEGDWGSYKTHAVPVPRSALGYFDKLSNNMDSPS
jgi:toxin ParE1/3/4